MTISRIIEVLEARLLTKGADCTREVHTACGSGMTVLLDAEGKPIVTPMREAQN